MTGFKSTWRILLWAALLGALAAAPVRAENFPSRPLHLIMPYSPGGIVDFTGRVVAQKLGDVLGQPVVPENRPGAGGIVGVDYVAHSAPDGYNFVIMDPAIVINPTLQKVPYDIFKDLVTISIVSSSPEVLVVAPELGIKTYAELVAYGKANPGKLNYASAGVGTAPHLAAAMWALSHRHPGHPRAVQGRGAVLRRPDEQQGADAVFQHRRRFAVYLQRQRHPAGHDRPQALAGLSRYPDGG
jgi:tripartite-type tricarboxylate transporter receptor subunit TctC